MRRLAAAFVLIWLLFFVLLALGTSWLWILVAFVAVIVGGFMVLIAVHR